MNMPKTFLLVASSVAMLASYAEDYEEVNQDPIADFEVIDGIDRFYLSSLATDGDDDPLFFEWQTESNLISIIYANSSLAFFTLPDIPHETEVLVKHIVTDGIESDTIEKHIQLPLITYLRRWGLGTSLDDEKSNDTDYDWNIDQMNTGTFSHINCGPASVTMAIKWADESFTGTPEDTSNTYRPNGGWWYTDNSTFAYNLSP